MAELFFAQLREDTQVERAVLTRKRATRIACIASGGCGALSLLDDTVEAVIAIDLSPAQCALVELRRAALAALERDAYLGFIGEREDTQRPATYAALPTTASVCTHPAPPPAAPPAAKSAPDLGADNDAVRRLISERRCLSC